MPHNQLMEPEMSFQSSSVARQPCKAIAGQITNIKTTASPQQKVEIIDISELNMKALSHKYLGDNHEDETSTISAVTWLGQDETSLEESDDDEEAGRQKLSLDVQRSEAEHMEEMMQDYEEKLMVTLAEADLDDLCLNLDDEGLFGESDSLGFYAKRSH